MLAVNPLIPGPSPRARQGLGTTRGGRRRPRRPIKPWRSSTRPTPPTLITGWPGCWPSLANRSRPAGKCSKPLEEAPPIPSKPTSSSSSSSAPTRPKTPTSLDRTRRRSSHDAKTPHPGRRPPHVAPRRRPGPGPARASRGGWWWRPDPSRIAPAFPTGGLTTGSRRTSSPSSGSSTATAAAGGGRGGFGGFGGGFGGGGGYGGGRWSIDFPDSDLNFSYRLQQLTSLKVNPKPDSPAS